MNLPPLPQAVIDEHNLQGGRLLYSIEQMRAYGQACWEAAQPKPLTDEEIEAVFDSIDSGEDAPWWYRYARAIEAAVRKT